MNKQAALSGVVYYFLFHLKMYNVYETVNHVFFILWFKYNFIVEVSIKVSISSRFV